MKISRREREDTKMRRCEMLWRCFCAMFVFGIVVRGGCRCWTRIRHANARVSRLEWKFCWPCALPLLNDVFDRLSGALRVLKAFAGSQPVDSGYIDPRSVDLCPCLLHCFVLVRLHVFGGAFGGCKEIGDCAPSMI